MSDNDYGDLTYCMTYMRYYAPGQNFGGTLESAMFPILRWADDGECAAGSAYRLTPDGWVEVPDAEFEAARDAYEDRQRMEFDEEEAARREKVWEVWITAPGGERVLWSRYADSAEAATEMASLPAPLEASHSRQRASSPT